MKAARKLTSAILATAIVFTSGMTAFAETKTAEKNNISIEDAVLHGIEHSRQLDEVEVEIDLAQVSKNRGTFKARKLRDGEKDIKDGIDALNKVEEMYDKGYTPDGVKIDTLPPAYQEKVKAEIEAGIKSGREQLDRGDSAIASALDLAGATIGSALDFASLSALSVDSSSNMMELMPSVAYEVTKASYDIYKNGIALLIQKSYYDVLQAQEMLRVKEKTMKRAQKQFEFAEAAYKEGMKPKDDMLMAKVYHQATKVDYEKTKGELNSALVEFKKNAGYRMDRDLKLASVMQTKAENFDLDAGLKSGMENRLEIKKTVGEVLIYTTNFTETKKSFTENTFQYKEAKLLQDKSAIKYEQAKDEVEASIRKSYELVNSTGDMLSQTQGMVASAKENLEISEYKYREGFGVDTAMLASMNLESSAGTIVEVLAAEEKLAEVEENIVKITYAYNLSRMQYKNNIGDFAY